MHKSLPSLSRPIAVLAALSFFLVPARDATAERGVSPYCSGTAPVRKVTIEAQEHAFSPDAIEARKGDCLELLIRASGSAIHYVVIEGTSVSSKGAPLVNSEGKQIGRALARKGAAGQLTEGRFSGGDQVLMRFQVNKAGTYKMKCMKQQMSVAMVVAQ